MRFRLVYFIKEALASFRKNWVMSMAAILTVFLCLLLVGFFVLVVFVGNMLIKGQEAKVEIEVFLKDNAPTDQVSVLQNRISSWDEVSSVKYVSKEAALKKLKEWLKDSPEILEAVSGNPLPASFQIKLKDPKEVEKVVSRMKRQPSIHGVVGDIESDIKYGQKWVPKFFAVTRIFRWIGAVIVSLLVFAALVLIVNVIRLAIFARRKEIAIMRLVGASNWFIRWPFILEGGSIGLIGAFLAIVVLYVVKTGVTRWGVASFLQWLGVTFNYSTLLRQFSLTLIGLILGGILIGATGSAIALRRYLKV